MLWSELNDIFTWWLTLEVQLNYIKILVFKILNLKHQNASCEQMHSILRWFSENRRGRLNIDHLELMTKIYSWYVTNSKNELKYLPDEITEEEIKNMVSNINQFDKYDEFLLDENDNNSLNEMNKLDTDILLEDQLDIDNIMDLRYELFNPQLQQNNTIIL
ncbi:13707_t:CDS:1, partial [Racocetra fulgida]